MAFGQTERSPHVIKGCLIDRTNKEPLPFVRVVLLPDGDTTVTDGRGCFVLEVANSSHRGRRSLATNYPGFDPYVCRVRPKDQKIGRTHRLKRSPIGPDVPVIHLRKRDMR